MNVQKEQAVRENLSLLARFANILVVVLLLLLLGFYAYHQSTNSGFFTENFGLLEMIMFYGSLLFAAAAPLVSALTGRRNPARLLQGLSNLVSAVAALWFLIVFPFNCAHLADTLPTSLKFVLAWITDDLAKIPLILQVIVGPLSAIATTTQYLASRREEQPTFRRRTS